jgi:hypothetical protein
MKSLNLSSIYKISIVLLLLSILVLLIFQLTDKPVESRTEQSEIGRYKEVRIPYHNMSGQIEEDIKILDTKTGRYVQ